MSDRDSWVSRCDYGPDWVTWGPDWRWRIYLAQFARARAEQMTREQQTATLEPVRALIRDGVERTINWFPEKVTRSSSPLVETGRWTHENGWESREDAIEKQLEQDRFAQLRLTLSHSVPLPWWRRWLVPFNG